MCKVDGFDSKTVQFVNQRSLPRDHPPSSFIPFLIAFAFDTLPSVIQKTKTKNLICITSSSLETKKHIKISTTSG